MSMRAKLHIAVIIAFVCLDSSLQAGVIPGRWEKVDELKPGSSITVTLKTGDTLHGKFAGSAADSIRITVDDVERELPKSAVSSVALLQHGWSRQKKAGVAALIGFPVGFAIGYAAGPYIGDDDSMPSGERAKAGAAIGAIIGGTAAAIAAVRGEKTSETVLYAAPAGDGTGSR